MEKNMNRHHAWFVIALYLLLVVAIWLPSTVSKYESSASGSDTAVIAKYDVGMTEPAQSIPLNGLAPGAIRTFTVHLTNNSDVSVSYEIDYETAGNLPLTVDVEEECGTLGYDSDNTATATVTVTWPADQSDPQYADMVDYLRVVVNFTQVD